MPRTRQAFEEMRDRSSNRILEAARRVFAKKGLGATVSDIAAEAGVSQGLAYRYFPSKEAIFHTLLRRMLEPREDDRLYQDSGKTPRERLERFISGAIRLRKENPEFYRLVFQAISEQKLPRDIHRKLKAHGREARLTLRRLIAEGEAEGEISKADPDQLADVILACLEGLSMRMAYPDPGAKVRLPDPWIVLRLLGPNLSKERGPA